MRNTLEYPVTYEEALDFLAKTRDSILSEGRMGDMGPYLCNWISTQLREKQARDSSS